MEHSTFYRNIQIEGLSIFYREAGPKDAATLLLLQVYDVTDGTSGQREKKEGKCGSCLNECNLKRATAE